jgi:hypothetical protein
VNADWNSEIAAEDVCNPKEHSQSTSHQAEYLSAGRVR